MFGQLEEWRTYKWRQGRPASWSQALRWAHLLLVALPQQVAHGPMRRSTGWREPEHLPPCCLSQGKGKAVNWKQLFQPQAKAFFFFEMEEMPSLSLTHKSFLRVPETC